MRSDPAGEHAVVARDLDHWQSAATHVAPGVDLPRNTLPTETAGAPAAPSSPR